MVRYDGIVIGGGPAGMFAAITAAQRGQKVLLLEKNGRLGKKLLITGKGRCNVTNDCDTTEVLKNVPPGFSTAPWRHFPLNASRNFSKKTAVP